MPQFKGQYVAPDDVLRVAGENDPGYDRMISQIWIRTRAGEILIPRSQLNEDDQVSEDDKKAAAERQGQSPAQAAVEQTRREAAARGMPPDQTPAPLIDDGKGSMVPNPDAIGRTGQAQTLEQEKQAAPTIDRDRHGSDAKQDMGNPGQGVGAPVGGPNTGIQQPSKPAGQPQQGDPKPVDTSGQPEGLGEDQRKEREMAENNPNQPGILAKPHTTPLP